MPGNASASTTVRYDAPAALAGARPEGDPLSGDHADADARTRLAPGPQADARPQAFLLAGGAKGGDGTVQDVVKVGGDGTVTWTPQTPKGHGLIAGIGMFDHDGKPVAIGRRDAQGWITLDNRYGGGRASEEAVVEAAHRNHFGPLQDKGPNVLDAEIAKSLAPLVSPSEVVPGSRTISMFVDGTGSFVKEQSNITSLYHDTKGTRFYYGGLGNDVEYPDALDRNLAGAVAKGFDRTIDRMYADLSHTWEPGTKVDLYGFSRGGAQVVEFARMVQTKGIEVGGVRYQPEIEHVGLFDPVYSVGQPGQDSKDIIATLGSQKGNYVIADLPANIKHADVLYAQHEERTFFPATRFLPDSPDTTLRTATVPGSHSDDGGHRENNQHIMKLARSWMEDGNAGADSPFKGSYRLSAPEFAEATSIHALGKFAPGAYGAQASDGFNFSSMLHVTDSFGNSVPSHQSHDNHQPRDLSWAGPSIIPAGPLHDALAHRRDALLRLGERHEEGEGK